MQKKTNGPQGRGYTLFPAQRNGDLLIAHRQNDLSVLDFLSRELIGLVPELPSKDLAFLHRFAIDDGETRPVIDRDRTHHKGRRQNVRGDMFRGVLHAGHRLPADGPERIAPAGIHRERGFVFQFNRDGFVAARTLQGDQYHTGQSEERFHRFRIAVLALRLTCWNCGSSASAWMVILVLERSGSVFSSAATAVPSVEKSAWGSSISQL